MFPIGFFLVNYADLEWIKNFANIFKIRNATSVRGCALQAAAERNVCWTRLFRNIRSTSTIVKTQWRRSVAMKTSMANVVNQTTQLRRQFALDVFINYNVSFIKKPTILFVYNFANLDWFSFEHDYVTLGYLPSPVRLLSVCNVRAPYSAGCNFPQCFYAILYPSHRLTIHAKVYGDCPRETLQLGVKPETGSQI